jgi:hypothetical protein
MGTNHSSDASTRKDASSVEVETLATEGIVCQTAKTLLTTDIPGHEQATAAGWPQQGW